MLMSSSAGKSSNSKEKEHTKVANDEMGGSSMTANLNGEVEVQKKMETTIGETSSGTNATDNTASKKRKREKMKNSNSDSGDVLSTRESTKEELSMTKGLEVKSALMVLSEIAILDANLVSKEQDHTEVASGKTGKSETTDLNVKGKETRKKKPKSKNKWPTLAEILNPEYIQSLEAAKGQTGTGTTSTGNSASETQKRQKLNLGDILSTSESTEERSSINKVLEVTSGEMVLAKTATLDANMVSKGDHAEIANGKMGESEPTNLNLNGKDKKKQKVKSKNKLPTLGEILSPRYLQNLEASKGEKGSGTTSTDNPASKTQKKQKLDRNSNLGDILSTHESTHEGLSTTEVVEVKCGEATNLNANGTEKKKRNANSKNKLPTLGEILNPQYLKNLEAARCETYSGTTSAANPASQQRKKEKRKNNGPDLGDILSTQEGLSITKVLEVKSGEMVLAKTATHDANMMSNENHHTEVSNGKTRETETTNFNASVNEKKKRKRKSKNKLPTLGEILNPQYLQNLEAAESEKHKRQRLNRNSDLADKLSCTHEGTQKGLSTTKVLEVRSGETVSGKTATSDANVVSKGDHTEVANGKMQENETNNLNVNGKVKKRQKVKSKNKRPTLGEILSPHYLQNLEASKGEKGSGTTSTDNPASKKQKKQKLDKISNLGDILSTHESTHEGLSTTEVVEVKCGEATNLNANGTEKKKRNVNSKNKLPTLGEILNPQYLQNLEAARGETYSGTTSTANPASQQRKKEKENNGPDLGDILSTQEGLSTTEVLEVKSGETVLAKTATHDTNMMSNENHHTEVSNGKTRETETRNFNASVNEKKKRKQKSKNKLPTLGEILNPLYLQNLEAAESEKRKRQRFNRNSDLGDKLSSTHEGTREGLSTTKVLEVKSGETVSGKTATSDVNMVSKGDHTEVANGKMQENETNNLNVNGKVKKKKKPKSKNKQPTSGESLNPQYLQHLEVAKHETGSESTVLKSIVGPQVASSEMGSTTIVLKSAKPDALEITEPKVNKEITQVATVGKKLIILDVNGLLADVVLGRPKDIRADKYVTRRAIFKRPHLDDFLRFCFERFNVGIWSSRTMKNLVPVVNYLLGDLRKKLLFMWDACKCTDSGIGTLEEKHKNIVAKDLRKIWDEDGPKMSWLKGTFHESNTLLVDDSPYKALLNPKHTGIFPASYSYNNRDDNFLGPKGELQTYLEGLAGADDVKTYVEQHPFGQGAIDEQSPHWAFYSSIIERFNDKNIMDSLNKKNKEKRRRCRKDSYHAL